MNTETGDNEVGRAIRAARQRLGMPQFVLAQRVGVNKGTVSKWESGTQHPSRHLAAVEAVLGIKLTDEEQPAVRPSELAQLSNDELSDQLTRIAAEVARRLPTASRS